MKESEFLGKLARQVRFGPTRLRRAESRLFHDLWKLDGHGEKCVFAPIL